MYVGDPLSCLLPPKEALALLAWELLHGISAYVSLGSWVLLSLRSDLRNIVTIYMRARKYIEYNVTPANLICDSENE